MDKIFKKLGARVTQVEVEYSRKMADGNYGSVGGMFRVTAEVAQGKNPDEAIDGLFAWIKEAAVRNMKPSFNEVVKTVAPPTSLHVPQEPTRVKLTPDGNEVDEYLVDSILVEYTPGGQKRAKVKGGKWKKYGVICWPEVLEEIDFDLDASDAADFPQQPGLTAIALMIEGKPKKVIGFK